MDAEGPAADEWTGVLPVDKAEGPTSHDVVTAARRAMRTRRIGHTGTLDPFASGLLLLCLGPATRLAEYLTPLPKTYRAVLRLGKATDTDDLTGETLRSSEAWRGLAEADIIPALQSQVGVIAQLPPLYSAKKVAGERMYAVARRGEAPERNPVQVTIHRIDILSVTLPDVEFEVECSSGTYIRAIARDTGEALDVGAHLRRLRRTAIGTFRVGAAVELDELEDLNHVRAHLLPPAEAVRHLPRLVVGEELAQALGHGRALPAPEYMPHGSVIAVCSTEGVLLAIGEARGDTIQPRKVFA